MAVTAAATEMVEAPHSSEPLLGEAERIRENAPPNHRSDFICTVSRFGERLVVRRELAYAIRDHVRAGRAWALVQNRYWGGS